MTTASLHPQTIFLLALQTQMEHLLYLERMSTHQAKTWKYDQHSGDVETNNQNSRKSFENYYNLILRYFCCNAVRGIASALQHLYHHLLS